MLGYLHIPFCHRVCPYCSFYKHTPGGISVRKFVDAVISEAKVRIPALPEPPRTLFLGGGTPSMLSPVLLEKLFNELRPLMPWEKMDEVCLEANPATFDIAKANLFRSCGVGRVSLGVQSFSERLLKLLGREHDPHQAAESIRILRKANIPSVNIDLMFSLPTQSLDEWRQTVQMAIELEPDHISAYNLTYEEDTVFFDSFQDGKFSQSEETNRAMYFEAMELLERAGYRHYETSNYARPGHESSHNRGYWRGENYIGMGPSAVSTVGNTRSRNISDTTKYMEMIDAVGHAIVDVEELRDQDQRIEQLAMGLRTSDGIPWKTLDQAGAQRMKILIGEGLAEDHGDHVILSKSGSALVDAIASEVC